MKKMKKLVSLLLAVVMVLAMTTSVFAAQTQVTITNTDGLLINHTFVAYQVFSGTQAESSTALGDVKWGSGVNGDELLSAIQKISVNKATPFLDCTTAKDVADILATASNKDVLAKEVAKLAYSNKTGDGIKVENGYVDVTPGYYLFVDTTKTDGVEDAANNAALLQVTGDSIKIQVKTDKPSAEKKVQENATNQITTVEKYGEQYNDVADYNIGDEVPFAFYSTVPDMTYYDTYKYVFHDKMSAGLTLKTTTVNGSTVPDVTVKIGTQTLTAGSEYEVKTTGFAEGHDCTFEVVITNLKAIEAATKGSAIRIDYKAILNTNAVIGLPGNPNTVYLEYSNNPNESEETGKTPNDTVIVFTYELDVTKIDGATPAEGTDPTKLPGAEFVLYRKVTDEDGNEKNEYVTVTDNKVSGWSEATVTEEDDDTEATITYPIGSKLTSGSDGLFKVSGLDEGTYYLKETKAPSGYNLLTNDIKLEITATTNNGQNWTDGVATSALTALTISVDDGTVVNGDLDKGIVSTNVENNQGATLPETGGIGTTIFYVVGVILVLGAGLLLITKKRMSAQK